MKTELYWKFIAFVLTIMLPQDGSGESVWERPSDKAKVRYLRTKVCITIKGETHCTYKNTAPDKPDEVATKFKSVENLSPDGDSDYENLMKPGKVVAKPKPKLPQYGSGGKVWEILFDKAKVHYDQSKVCVTTIEGETQCTNNEPGNHDEMAAMFKLLNDDSNNEALMPGKFAVKPKTKDENYDGLFMEAADVENQGKIIDFLITEQCQLIQGSGDKSVKILIVLTAVIHDCIRDIIRVLTKNGTLVVIGKDRGALGVAIAHIYKETELYYNKYYQLPENIQRGLDEVYGKTDLERKAFVNSEAFTEQLYELIIAQKYKEAVDLSKYIHKTHFDHFNKTVIPKVHDQLLQEGDGDKLMSFLYKLVKLNGKDIMECCFSLTFQGIFYENTVRLLDKERKDTTWMDDEEYGNVRPLFTKCGETKDRNRFLKFNPLWNTTLNSVVFEIKNPAFVAKIMLSTDTIGTDKHLLAWGDKKPEAPLDRYAWCLKPGLNENGEIVFCIVNVMHDQGYYLSQGDCDSFMIGIKDTCTPDMGWFIDILTPKS